MAFVERLLFSKIPVLAHRFFRYPIEWGWSWIGEQIAFHPRFSLPSELALIIDCKLSIRIMLVLAERMMPGCPTRMHSKNLPIEKDHLGKEY